ncbi:hypothetical protein [Parasphingorhabdus sp.]|uniref:hypothetical protein n=1 Tax=Parasphingorhabdus sp. TaxID=2709688 RepID=UPI0030010BEF
MLTGTNFWIAALTALSPAAATAQNAAAFDPQIAAAAFVEGEAEAPMVYNVREVSRCNGRWMLHADAVDDGAFPGAAMDAFPEALRLPYAMQAVEFFRTTQLDHPAYRDAADAAERQLQLALAGDSDASRTYFEALGQCSMQPEEVRDYPADAVDAPASPSPETAFERLKALAGVWQPLGKPESALRIRFYPTARGSVLVEEWTGNGQPHSLTLYHRDGEALLATHYCPQGNQPRLALAPDSDGAIRFAFRDATDLDPAQEQHQSALRFALTGPGRMTRSETYRDGDGDEHPSQLQLERISD